MKKIKINTEGKICIILFGVPIVLIVVDLLAGYLMAMIATAFIMMTCFAVSE